MKQPGKFAQSYNGKRGAPQLGLALWKHSGGVYIHQVPAEQAPGLAHTAPPQHYEYSDQPHQT